MKRRIVVHNHYARDRYTDRMTLKVTVVGDEGEVARMLDYIGRTAAIGHSFSVVVDPGDSEYEKKFSFDGDGAFRIEDIK